MAWLLALYVPTRCVQAFRVGAPACTVVVVGPVDVAARANVHAFIVDPGGGEYLTTPCDLDDWHDAVADPELDPLAWPFYAAWRAANPAFGELGFDQAIGYRVPLFLGGEDEVTNLDVTPRALYFDICTQLRLGTLDLAPGTTIAQIRVQR